MSKKNRETEVIEAEFTEVAGLVPVETTTSFLQKDAANGDKTEQVAVTIHTALKELLKSEARRNQRSVAGQLRTILLDRYAKEEEVRCD